MKIWVGDYGDWKDGCTLTGPALDYAVAIAEGIPHDLAIKMVFDGYSPSTDWSQCGQLIDKYYVLLNGFGGEWQCEVESSQWLDGGETAQIAICRAVVGHAVNSGTYPMVGEDNEDIEIPDELVG